MVSNPAVSEAEIATVYRWAMKYADRRSARTSFGEAARDGATDGVLWSIRHFCPGPTNTFAKFAKNVVRRFVHRHIAKAALRFHARPPVEELPEALFASDRPAAGAAPMDEAIRDLPADLRDAVRLFMLDKFSLRDCGLLLGVAPQTVRMRLKEAAMKLNPGAVVAPRPNGRKRLVRT